MKIDGKLIREEARRKHGIDLDADRADELAREVDYLNAATARRPDRSTSTTIPPYSPRCSADCDGRGIVTDDIAGMSLTDVSTALRRGAISSTEATRACLARIESQQPRINCFVSIDVDGALSAAARADEEIAAGGWRGPLHGVPLAHKDMFYRAGEVSGFGSRICRDRVADDTSEVMERVDAGGAIDLGPLHMTEFAVGHTGAHAHLGSCRNPWNTAHVPGGSSSGSGAAVASRLIYGSVASDTGGSCRLPAAMCGVVGIKPTFGLVSRHGGMPRAWSLDVFGVYARSVDDAAALLDVIAGEDQRDPATLGSSGYGTAEGRCGTSADSGSGCRSERPYSRPSRP